jgi:hypothetical protein
MYTTPFDGRQIQPNWFFKINFFLKKMANEPARKKGKKGAPKRSSVLLRHRSLDVFYLCAAVTFTVTLWAFVSMGSTSELECGPGIAPPSVAARDAADAPAAWCRLGYARRHPRTRMRLLELMFPPLASHTLLATFPCTSIIGARGPRAATAEGDGSAAAPILEEAGEEATPASTPAKKRKRGEVKPVDPLTFRDTLVIDLGEDHGGKHAMRGFRDTAAATAAAAAIEAMADRCNA